PGVTSASLPGWLFLFQGLEAMALLSLDKQSIHNNNIKKNRLQFDAEVKGLVKQENFSINVREQLSVAFAVGILHIWIDNKYTLAWSNRLQSTNEFSQVLNQIVGVAEAIHSFRLSAEHISGSQNAIADLGSRAWSNLSVLIKWRSLL
ncbi:hypothetical protein GN958_ATG14901, partial [Phytophthora infestans]